MNEQQVINLIQKYSTAQGGTIAGTTVPIHWHRGPDAPQIYGGDLLFDSRGIQFLTSRTPAISITTDPSNILYITNLDGSGNENQLVMSPTATSILLTNAASNNAEYIFLDDALSITATLPWIMQLPVNPSLPLSPVEGQICFYGGHLQVCEVTGTWTAL